MGIDYIEWKYENRIHYEGAKATQTIMKNVYDITSDCKFWLTRISFGIVAVQRNVIKFFSAKVG